MSQSHGIKGRFTDEVCSGAVFSVGEKNSRWTSGLRHFTSRSLTFNVIKKKQSILHDHSTTANNLQQINQIHSVSWLSYDASFQLTECFSCRKRSKSLVQ